MTEHRCRFSWWQLSTRPRELTCRDCETVWTFEYVFTDGAACVMWLPRSTLTVRPGTLAEIVMSPHVGAPIAKDPYTDPCPPASPKDGTIRIEHATEPEGGFPWKRRPGSA